MSQGLKPALLAGWNVRAKARTYLRNKNKGKNNDPGLKPFMLWLFFVGLKPHANPKTHQMEGLRFVRHS